MKYKFYKSLNFNISEMFDLNILFFTNNKKLNKIIFKIRFNYFYYFFLI